jgi:hypothetical protein
MMEMDSSKMRVLVGCETSGVVREAFRAKGHHAVSCDILPADDGSSFHIQNDVLQVIATSAPFDLMIAHPPCTYLCNSGVSWLHRRHDGRWIKLQDAMNFFNALQNSNIPKIAIENPIPHRYAKDGLLNAMSKPHLRTKGIGKYTQIIQPYQFGHPERKATCLWLKNLPKLTSTCIVPLPMDKKKAQRLHWLPPSKDRWKIRSRTFEGIAKAMAEQWG